MAQIQHHPNSLEAHQNDKEVQTHSQSVDGWLDSLIESLKATDCVNPLILGSECNYMLRSYLLVCVSLEPYTESTDCRQRTT